jgi:hypothetical protein
VREESGSWERGSNVFRGNSFKNPVLGSNEIWDTHQDYSFLMGVNQIETEVVVQLSASLREKEFIKRSEGGFRGSQSTHVMRLAAIGSVAIATTRFTRLRWICAASARIPGSCKP